MAELSRPVRILQTLPLLRGLAPAELGEIALLAKYVTVRSGAYFFRQGEGAALFYVLLRGRVKQTQAAAAGREILLQFLQAGQILGPTAALGHSEYPVSARAMGLCEAAAWDGEVMAELMARYPSISLRILEGYAALVEDLRERVRDLATARVESRLARALLRLADDAGWETDDGVLIDLPLSRQDLAEMTGTTLFTVSRVLQGWERAGLVHVGRQRVAVRAREGLAALLAE